MNRIALSVLLLAGALAQAAGVKGERTYAPHDPIVLKAVEVTSKDAQFLWDVAGAAKVVESGDTLYVWAPPGKYTVKLTAIDFEKKKVERATLSFTVTGDAPAPPGPDPGPKPPPGPEPTALQKAVKEAFAKEAAHDKHSDAHAFMVVYQVASSQVREKKLKTLGQLWKSMQVGVDAGSLGGKLPLVQAAIAAHMKPWQVSSSVVIDDSNRERLAADLAAAADALKGVAP